jgi:glycosyltransferase involved in cell wall biosynthesis
VTAGGVSVEEEPRWQGLRVLHCPTIVAGNAQQLARSERECGLASQAVVLQQSMWGYETDEVLCPPGAGPIRIHLARLRLLQRALRDFEVVHFNFGQTILAEPFWETGPVGPVRKLSRFLVERLAYRDLALLRAAGKPIVVTFQGDDARQGDYCRTHFDISFVDEVEQGYYSESSDQRKRERIAQFDRFADRIYSVNPDLLHVLPERAEFLPYASVDLRRWTPPAREPGEVPVIAHAPSHRGVKGTRHVLEAVERLRGEGFRFEFRLIERIPHSRVREEYERADFLVDQLLAGWYGGLAVEFMALGKPVAAYLRQGDLHFIPETMREELPVLQATPASIHGVLKDWLSRPREEWVALGRRSRAYVERWHDPLRIARSLAAEYADLVAARRTGRRAARAGSAPRTLSTS